MCEDSDDYRDEDLITQWIEERYEELILAHPSASGGPCHVSLDDGNYQLIYEDMLVAAIAIVRKFNKDHDMPLRMNSLFADDDIARALDSFTHDLYDNYPTEVLMASYLTLKNIVDIIGRDTLKNL
jgi:hypothetical protein